MVFILFFLSSRLFLSDRVVTNLTINNKISKKFEGSWYYAKCQKNRNCTDIINTIKKSYNITDISIISNKAFTIYLSKENSKILQLLNLKFTKIPKNDKIIKKRRISTQYSNNYIVFLSKSCQIPYNTTKVASNYLIFQSNESFETVSQKLSKIGCVRLLEQLPNPRLNTNAAKSSKNTKKSKQQVRTRLDDTQLNSATEDLFSVYNNFKEEDGSYDFYNSEFTKQITDGNIFSLHLSSSHQNLLRHGINGRGQVASIVDTGLDTNLCWFVDPEREIEYGKETPSDHRKIQGYFTYADDSDISPGGHGSFVSGIIAGSALCDLYVNDRCAGSYFNGVAPHAKLVINDVFAIRKPKSYVKKLYLENEKQSNENTEESHIKMSNEINENSYKLLNKMKKKKEQKPKTKTKSTKSTNSKQNNKNAEVLQENQPIKSYSEDSKSYNAAKLFETNKYAADTGNEDHKKEAEYKKKVKDERKMRGRFGRKGKIENTVRENDENENEIIYYNPYDDVNQEQIIASFPQNLSKLFELPSKNFGATVQYHGFDFREKSLFTSLIDTFAYENPSMTLVFPSGDQLKYKKKIKNKGDDYSYSLLHSLDDAAVSGMKKAADFSFDKTVFTNKKVSSPGDSKNVLTVGATTIDPFVSINEFKMHSPTSPIIVVHNGVEYLGYCDEFHGISFFDYIIKSIQLSKDGLKNHSYSFVLGDQVFIETEKLDGYTFIQSPKFESTEILILFKSNEITTKINKPIIRLPEEYLNDFVNGNKIQIKFFDDLESLHLIKSSNSHSNAKYSQVNPHYFRRKPDIFLQGGPVYGPNSGSSKSSSNYCGADGLRIGEGTSVAAAFATGEILLIQQYIKEGFSFYNRSDAASHTIRAILSNIAINDDDNNRVPDLDRFCIFKDSYKMDQIGGIRFFSDSISSDSFHVYKFKAQFKGNLKVTVAWNDPPHDPFAPSDVLFKLDCRIESIKDGKMYGDVHYDPLNTVKNYVINDVNQDDEFKIFVICGDILFFEKLNYTIVISGPFDHFDSENQFVSKIEDNKNKGQLKCLQQCKDKSKCVNGYCQCAKKKYGEDCSKDMIEMHNHQTLPEINLLPHDSVFMSYVFKQWKPGSKLSFTFKIKKIISSPKNNQKSKNDESIKIDEVHYVEKSNENKNYEDDIDLNEKLFFMFSINKIPTWQSANCDSDNSQWVSIEGNSLVIEYHLWNFVRNGDTLYLVAYSRENCPISFSVSSSELYN